MNRTIDVKNEVRKLASSKPVHAAAGAGVLATQTLRELPSRLGELPTRMGELPTRLGELPGKLGELPGRIANMHLETTMVTLPARANEVVQTARAKAVDEYERLVSRGRQALNSDGAPASKGALNGKGTRRSTTSRSTTSRSTKSK